MRARMRASMKARARVRPRVRERARTNLWAVRVAPPSRGKVNTASWVQSQASRLSEIRNIIARPPYSLQTCGMSSILLSSSLMRRCL